MSALKANLWAMISKSGVCVAIAMFVFFAVFMTVIYLGDKSPLAERDWGWIGIQTVFVSWMLGYFIGIAMVQMMVSPFAFLLPDFYRVMRKTIFALGIGLLALPSLFCLPFSEPDIVGRLGILVATLFVGLTMFWVGVVLSLFKNAWGLFSTILLVWILFGQQGQHLNRWIARITMEYSVAPVIVGLVVSRLAWILLGCEEFMRNRGRALCGQIPTESDPEGKWKYLRESLRNRPIRLGWITKVSDGFCLRRMMSCDPRGRARFIWGQLGMVAGFGGWTVHAESLLMGVPIFILAFGYIFGEAAMPLSLLLLLLLPQPCLPAYSQQITIGGRRERFRATVLSTAVLAACATFLIAGIALTTVPLERILPDISIADRQWSFHAVSLRFWYGAFILLPLLHLVLILVPEFSGIQVLAVLILIPMMADIVTEGVPFRGESVLAIGLIVVSWGAYILACRMVCLKWSLVREGCG
jgi:hypothetical protein